MDEVAFCLNAMTAEVPSITLARVIKDGKNSLVCAIESRLSLLIAQCLCDRAFCQTVIILRLILVILILLSEGMLILQVPVVVHFLH